MSISSQLDIEEVKKELKLSYISPALWWRRSLPVSSKEWKELRIKILERDSYACFFCGIKASKYMIVDHISGNAMNNEETNLRVLCPMCDTIRHSGLAGIKGTLDAKESNLSQLEIVKRTREFYLKNKRCPLAKEIDPKCKNTDLAPIEIAVKEDEEMPEEMKKYKGFFTSRANFKFLEFLL